MSDMNHHEENSTPLGDSPSPVRLKTFSSLQDRNFRLLWIGVFISINGMQMLIIARGWLVYTMTDSALALGMVAAGLGLPMLVFSLFGGAVADRIPKKNMLVLSQCGLFVINLAICVLITTRHIALWHLISSAFLTGVISAFNMPARQSFIVELVGRENLTNAIALNSTAQNVCRIASPALGGLLLKFIGVSGVYWIVVASYGLEIIILMMIAPDKVVPVRRGSSLIHDILAGFTYIRHNRIIFSLLIMAFVPIIVASPYASLMPVFAKSVFQVGETGLGLLMAAGGIGALGGSTLIASLGNFQRKGRMMLISGLIFGLALTFFGLSPSFTPAFIFMVFVGAGGSMYMTLITSLIMNNTPRDLIGRVMSIFIMTFGLMPMAVLPAGALAEVFSAPMVVSAGGLLLFLFLAGMNFKQPEIKRLT